MPDLSLLKEERSPQSPSWCGQERSRRDDCLRIRTNTCCQGKSYEPIRSLAEEHLARANHAYRVGLANGRKLSFLRPVLVDGNCGGLRPASDRAGQADSFGSPAPAHTVGDTRVFH